MRQGSGLGLAICHEIAEALGGSITLDNRMDHGRVSGLDATVRLPLARAMGHNHD
jgi:two-component system sensor histidine kinase TctE